jgi:hypothetical protein
MAGISSQISAVSTASRRTTISVTLKPSRSVSVDCKISNCVSVPASILERLDIRAVSG